MNNDRMDQVLKRIEAEERARSRAAWMPLTLLGLALMGGVGALYYFTDKQDKAYGDVVLPAVLIHQASPARADLAMLCRSMYELAVEIDHKLTRGSPDNYSAVEWYGKRLRQAHFTGRNMEPLLTREESRVLMAAQHAEGSIEGFLQSALSPTGFNHDLIAKAIKQLDRARALARGEAQDDGGLAKIPVLGMVSQVKSVTEGLAEIKQANAKAKAIEKAALKESCVPELDGHCPK